MESKDGKVVSINQDNGKSEVVNIKDGEAAMVVDGEVIMMESFVLSGCSTKGDNVILTYNTSLDEAITFKEMINVTVQQQLLDKIKK